MRALALGEGRAVVDGGADQRVPKTDDVADGDQLPGLCRSRRFAAESEFLACPPQQARVAGRVGGSGQQRSPVPVSRSLSLGRRHARVKFIAAGEPANWLS
jgi:hypothetical protein